MASYVNGNFRGCKNIKFYDKTRSNSIKADDIRTSLLVANNIKATTISQNINTVVQYAQVMYDNTYTIDPDVNRNFVMKFDTIDNNADSLTFTLDIDRTHAEINDQVTIIFIITTTNHPVNMILSDNFWYTRCGSRTSSYNLTGNLRWALQFIYDGEKYVNSTDNC